MEPSSELPFNSFLLFHRAISPFLEKEENVGESCRDWTYTKKSTLTGQKKTMACAFCAPARKLDGIKLPPLDAQDYTRSEQYTHLCPPPLEQRKFVAAGSFHDTTTKKLSGRF
jgi:hypothetical protein